MNGIGWGKIGWERIEWDRMEKNELNRSRKEEKGYHLYNYDVSTGLLQQQQQQHVRPGALPAHGDTLG